MEILNLPVYEKITLPLSDFFNNTNIINDLGPLYYVIISSNNSKFNRLSKSGLDKSGILKYIYDNINKQDFYNFSITIQQFFPNKYGGNIIVKNDGTVLAEFGEGKQSKITEGSLSKGEIFHVNKNFNDISFKFSFDSIELRELIMKVIKYIPNDSLRDFIPGYYEFIIGDYNGQDKIIFIDARLNKSYNV